MHPKRREKGITKAKRVLKILRSRNVVDQRGHYKNESKWAKRMVCTRVRCSCDMCGNPRKSGFKHRKELIADDRQRQQINELE
jgi:hypothetical protein